MIISAGEILDIALMTAAVGYIFMYFIRRASPASPESYLKKQSFDWDAFKIACLVTAPALILHELAHKFAALGFGFSATFHAAYTFLALGIILRLMQSSFIFFVPAYVSIGCYSSAACSIPPLQSSIIAAAGPFANLAIFLGVLAVLKYKKKMKKKTIAVLQMTKVINIFLFIFNMLPFYFFDGYKVFSGLFNHFF